MASVHGGVSLHGSNAGPSSYGSDYSAGRFEHFPPFGEQLLPTPKGTACRLSLDIGPLIQKPQNEPPKSWHTVDDINPA